MTGIIIIIFTLLLAYIDKPHLFKKPINRGKVFISLVLLTTAMFSAYKEISDNRDADISSKKIDSLSTASKIQLALIDTLRKEARIASKEYEDSLVQFHLYNTELLARYSIKVDTLSNKIVRIDKSIIKEVLPTLIQRDLPVFEMLNGENVISYDVLCHNADAHIISNYHILVGYDNDKCIGRPKVSVGGTNATTVILNGEIIGNSLFLERVRKEMDLPEQFVLAIEYQYRSKNGVEQRPLRKIYIVDQKKKTFEDVSNSKFAMITKYFQSFGHWKNE